MAPITQASDESNHQALMDKLDVYNVRKPFRKQSWKPAQRRNKNTRQIISEASRKELSAMPTQDNSGASTPMPAVAELDTGATTPAQLNGHQPNMVQANRDLSAYVREKNAQNGMGCSPPTVTYTNIDSAPSLHPSSQRHYCDVTGLPAPYTDPNTRLRYHNGEIFGVVRSLAQGSTEGYLFARGAQIILK